MLRQWQPEVLGDLDERAPEECVGSRRATVPYLAEAMREHYGKIDGVWSTISSDVGEYERADEQLLPEKEVERVSKGNKRKYRIYEIHVVKYDPHNENNDEHPAEKHNSVGVLGLGVVVDLTLEGIEL